MIKDPLKLATNYFPLNFHWILEYNGKNLSYYSTILFHEKLVLIKSIPDKIDKSKIIYHSVFILNVITEEKWGFRPVAIKPLPNSAIPYSYHDYIQAWFKFMIYIYIYIYILLEVYLNQAQTELDRGSTIGNPVERALA